MEEYQVIHEIGSGSYGSVFSVQYKKNLFALKISLLNDNEALNSGVIREWIFSKSFIPSHHVCPILKKWSDRKHSFFLMPLYDCSLYEYIRENADIPYESFETIAASVHMGIMNMHKQNWLHRDLKPENIYMDRAGHIVVGDFNLVRFQDLTTDVRDDDSFGTTHVCTLWSRAPELVWGQLQGKNVIHTGNEIDAFSFGMILLCICRGDYVFGKHVEGAGNTKEVRYLNALLSFCGVDEEIRKAYDILPSQLFDEFPSREKFIPYLPASWSTSQKKETADLLASLLDPLPQRRKKLESCSFAKTSFDTKLCEKIANSRKEKAIGVYGPGTYVEEKMPATLAQLSVVWTMCVTKNIPVPLAMHTLLASKRLPIYRSSAMTSIFNMLHMVHRNTTFNETFIEVTARCFLDSLYISPKLWSLCKEIESEPFLCSLLAGWIATRYDIPSRQDLDSDKKIIFVEGIEAFFNRKQTRTMLESWRRLD
jgi:serine/threonine protein kinase